MTRPQIILDTSPLITLCTFQAEGQTIIEHLLAVASLILVESVAAEATANPTHADALIVEALLVGNRLARLPMPSTTVDAIIDSYTKLGQGERDTIRLGLTMPDVPVVLDDYLAFLITLRFGLKPILLLDLIPAFVADGQLQRTLARSIVDQIAPRYSLPFVNHTRYKLEQIIS